MTIDIHGPCTTALKALRAWRNIPMRKADVGGGSCHVD
jgi:hypothetical protein